jgi:putative membrane protein
MTSNNPDNFQQQIIFNDDEFIENTNTNGDADGQQTDQVFAEQIMFDNKSYTEPSNGKDIVDIITSTEVNAYHVQQDEAKIKGHKHSWIWILLITAFALLIVIEAVNFFIIGFQMSPVVTSLYALLLATLILLCGNALLREFIGLRQFTQRQALKQQAMSLLSGNDNSSENQSFKNTKDFCDKISVSLPCDLMFDDNSEKSLWHSADLSHYNSREILELYSRNVLCKVDEKALHEVAKFSTEAVVLVALSPVAIIDMLIILSRNLRMINKIAGLYGLQLSYWSRIKLIKQVFVNMAYAGVSELVADFGTEMLGAELLGKLSARFAQGLGAGMLTARLGSKTMELCRPIPFKEKPKLSCVRKKIASQIKLLITNSN